MNVIKRGLISLMLLWSANASALPILTLVPSATSLEQGEALRVDAMVSGLQNELIGSFDLTIQWNEGAFAFQNLSFGSYLDGPINSIQGFDAQTNSLNAFEVSLGLLEGQSGLTGFQLFRFDLLALGDGLETLSFTTSWPQILGDEQGFGYENVVFTGATVAIGGPSTSVPEPSTAVLLLIGATGFLLKRRKHFGR